MGRFPITIDTIEEVRNSLPSPLEADIIHAYLGIVYTNDINYASGTLSNVADQLTLLEPKNHFFCSLASYIFSSLSCGSTLI
jgi:hypothetical protein